MKTALVLDDSQIIRKIVRRVLEDLNYRVFEAKDASEGLEVIRMQTISFVICDYKMPGLDGIQFAQKMRETERNKAIPIVMLSANTDSNVKEAAINSGSLMFINKPFSPRRLAEYIEIIDSNKSMLK